MVNKAKEVIVDTTVQEKNITFSTDAKLYKKVITKCNRIAKSCGIELRQSYRFVVQRLHYAQCYAHLARHAQQAKRALKKLSMLAGRQVRDLHRQLIKLGKEELYAPMLPIMARDYCRIAAGCFILFLGDISGLTHACFWPIELLQEAY
jgi:hypothetical protein